MKFGGSSLSTLEKMKHVANIIINRKEQKNKIIAVVSAPGDKTDELVTMIKSLTEKPSRREVDVLLTTGEMISIALLTMTLCNLGEKAISMTGYQAGIVSDSNYTHAKIKKINVDKINEYLEKDNIIIVAGFQGVDINGNLTTLGRGGSDLTAVALAASLCSNYCEIYSDVDGVYTTDPRLVKKARKIDFLSYDTMIEMSETGAQVLQLRSIEVAKKYNVSIYAKSTFNENSGTLITNVKELRRKKMEEPFISGITFDKSQVKFSLFGLPNISGIIAKILVTLARGNIIIDLISQFINSNNENNIVFTVNKNDMLKTKQELKILMKELQIKTMLVNDKIVKISIIGLGIKSDPNIIARIFSMMYEKDIDFEMISTSDIRVSFIVNEINMQRAVESLHNEFKLSKIYNKTI
jgi:aspartate kinase